MQVESSHFNLITVTFVDLLVSTSKSLLSLNAQTGEGRVIHSGKGLYYGITYSDNAVFVAARNNKDCFNYLEKQENERGEILIFDYHMKLVDVLHAPFALNDLHQILLFDNKLWITCSSDNMVVIYDFNVWKKWYPSDSIEARGKDVNHFNSLFYDGQSLYILAHNLGESEIWHFSYPGLKIRNKIKIGCQGHNIWKRGGELFTCDSQNGVVVSAEGRQVELGKFPRGVVVTEKWTVVGTSDIAERSLRNKVSSKVIVFDSLWNKMSELSIDGHGQLLDIRSPGVIDFCVPGVTGCRLEIRGKKDLTLPIKHYPAP